MKRYILKRIFYIFPTLLVISFITFLIVHLTPGEPAALTMIGENPNISPESIERIRKIYHLDEPFIKRYVLWLKDIATLNFGKSFIYKDDVIKLIMERLPATIMLNIVSLFAIFIVAIPLGVYSAINYNKTSDKLITVFTYIGYSFPSFWLALILMLTLGVKLGWLPIAGKETLGIEQYLDFAKYGFSGILYYIWDRIKYMIMPVICYSVGGIAVITRYMRGAMLDVIRQDYIKTAFAKGLSPARVYFIHAFRNSLIPIVTIIASFLPGLIEGSFIIESIFAWPGLGRLGYMAIMQRDIPIIMATTIMSSFLVLVANLLADISYAYIDPRIRYEG